MGTDKKASEIIREVRNVLFERGWYQGGFEGPDGSVCMEGALNCAVYGTAAHGSVWSPGCWSEAMGHLGQVTKGSPFRFNDAPGRSFDEVIDALDRAEKLALIDEETQS